MSQPNYDAYADFDDLCAAGDLATANRAIAQLQRENAALRADLAAATAGLAAIALPSSADELTDIGLTYRQLDAALTEYSTGSLTTYTPVGERLVLASIPY